MLLIIILHHCTTCTTCTTRITTKITIQSFLLSTNSPALNFEPPGSTIKLLHKVHNFLCYKTSLTILHLQESLIFFHPIPLFYTLHSIVFHVYNKIPSIFLLTFLTIVFLWLLYNTILFLLFRIYNS